MSNDPCGGVVERDQDGNLLRQGACEVHLFDEGVCAWQKRTNEQSTNKRSNHD